LLDIHPDRRNLDVVDLAAEKLRNIIDNGATAKELADAGESLDRLGDRRDLEKFISIKGDKYSLRAGKMHVEAFEISKYPVTNQWYSKFITAGGYDNPDYWDADGKQWLDSLETRQPAYWHAWRFNCPNAPVVGVSFYEAIAFCHWLTATLKDGHTYHLPGENQWEAAAAGLDERKYPWGEWKKDSCNTYEAEIGKTSSVGIFLKGNTPEGVSDMGGNVFEWTVSEYDEDSLVLRGGCWNVFRSLARCANRFRDHPGNRIGGVGFRCVRT
jgi:formylglycine-generating enzyme required for sulfatase activity